MPVLHAIALEGYRSFAKLTWLELKPLTLLYGRNNAGKSSFLRALAIVARSITDQAQGPWDMGDDDGPGFGANFASLPWRGEPNLHRFSIHLKWRFEDGSFIHDSFTLEHDGPLSSTYIKSLAIYTDDVRVEWSRHPPKDKTTQVLYEYLTTGELRSLKFQGLVPLNDDDKELAALRKRLYSLKRQIQWLHAGRKRPPHILKGQGTSPFELQSDGGDAAYKLAVQAEQLLEPVSKFYANPTINRTLKVEAATPQYSKLLLNPKNHASFDINIVDVGDGMSKVLPVLVATSAASRQCGPPIVLIEDPDVHLHEDAVRALAEYLAALVSTTPDEHGMRIVLETHSNTFQLAVRLCIKKGLLKPEQVELLWASAQDDGQTSLEKVKLNEQGGVVGHTLRGAFAENSELAAKLAGL